MPESTINDIPLLDEDYVGNLKKILSAEDFNQFLISVAQSWQNLIEKYREIELPVKPEPGDIPNLKNIDIYGESLQFSGSRIGGDHIVYLDFSKRFDLDERIHDALASPHLKEFYRKRIVRNLELNKKRAGLVLADVAGHDLTDSTVVGQFHQPLLLGASYELTLFGEITLRLFEELNKRFYNTHNINKSIALTYGEIWENGKFRFMLAGNPMPLIFSKEYNGFVKISQGRIASFTALGIKPSLFDPDQKKQKYSPLGYKKRYTVNEINLMVRGDILLIHTDGLSDHTDQAPDEAGNRGNLYFPQRLEEKLREVKDLSAKEIFGAIKSDIFQFGPLSDDTSYIVVKRN